jgi:hypothetical protein
MHGPDPLIEGKHLAFEAQLREELGERAIHGINQAEAELPGVMDRARQGLATLRRRLSDSMEGIGWGGGAGGTNNPPPEVGEVSRFLVIVVSRRVGVVFLPYVCRSRPPLTQVGYGDPASELHSTMKEAMEEAAKVSKHAWGVIRSKHTPADSISPNPPPQPTRPSTGGPRRR